MNDQSLRVVVVGGGPAGLYLSILLTKDRPGAVVSVLERNTPIPASATQLYTTGVDRQTHVEIHVLQGERELAADNRSLAHLRLGPLEPLPAGLPRVEVMFTVDENGCLRVIPGSHRTPVSHRGNDDSFFNQETEVDEARAVDVELERGACSIHSAMLVHGSPPNRSKLRRCGYTMRYMPTTVRFLKSGDHRIYLARGRDHAGNVYAPVP